MVEERQKTGWNRFWRIGILLLLAYSFYTLFPFGLLADTAEKGDGVKQAQMASDPAQKTANAVVVELFTSQGCSSCPPAEAYMRELAVRPDVIALEFHVDYWDDLAYGLSGKWKDPFSNPQATLRQADYNSIIRKTQNIYTPQMVVDGWLQAVGSRRNEIAGMIEKSRADRASPVEIRPQVDRSGNLSVSVSGAAADTELMYVRLLKRRVTQVQAGENKGETLASYNIATRWFSLGFLEESPAVFSKKVDPLGADETCVVLLQARQTKRILGAAFCR